MTDFWGGWWDSIVNFWVELAVENWCGWVSLGASIVVADSEQWSGKTLIAKQ